MGEETLLPLSICAKYPIEGGGKAADRPWLAENEEKLC
jgi:hypothetical protein